MSVINSCKLQLLFQLREHGCFCQEQWNFVRQLPSLMEHKRSNYPSSVVFQQLLELGRLSGEPGGRERHPPLFPDGSALHLLPVLLDGLLHPLLPLERRRAKRLGGLCVGFRSTHAVRPASVFGGRALSGRDGHRLVPLPSLLPPPTALQLPQVGLEALGLLRTLLSQSLGDGSELSPVKSLGAALPSALSRPALGGTCDGFSLCAGGLVGWRVLGDIRPYEALQRREGTMILG